MSWGITYRCEDCPAEVTHEVSIWNGAAVTPQGDWVAFGDGYSFKGLRCPDCANRLAELGRMVRISEARA